MPKLNQIIALSKGRKTRTESVISKIYHTLSKSAELFSGFVRTYRPLDDEGDKLPDENKRVQLRVTELVKEACASWEALFDATATLDESNKVARGDVVVGDTLLLASVPVTHLLFLDKQLTNIATFIGKLPTLNPAFDWKWSKEADCYVTTAEEKIKTKKIHKPFVKSPATMEHPAQVDVITEDVLVGYWKTVGHNGAIPEGHKRECLERVMAIQDAVKSAREKANSIDASPFATGKPVLDYIFKGNTAS